jgi:hypothetical protein
MHYLIQENIFRETNYDVITKALQRLDLPYTTVRIYPYIDKITEAADAVDGYIPSPDDLPELEVSDINNVFIFGSIKLARIAAEKGWVPGSLVSSNHDFLHYGPIFGDHMLNSDSEIVSFFDLANTETQNKFWKTENHKLFIRPTHDGKLFDAAVFTQIDWRINVERLLLNKPDLLMVYEKLQVAKPKKVKKEIRVWIVNGKVITASQYRLNMSYCVDALVEPSALKFAQDMANLYNIADAYVMDVCLCEDSNDWKIVELGCINSAGFYLADLQRILIALEDFYSSAEK